MMRVGTMYFEVAGLKPIAVGGRDASKMFEALASTPNHRIVPRIDRRSCPKNQYTNAPWRLAAERLRILDARP